MLFCDVKGSTAAAEQLDPEDWAEVMNGVFEYMIRPVYKFEGTVVRLMGDAILAFFGAPIAHEDDPQRAILAGLEIIERFEPERGALRARWGLDLNVRVGINTGLVMVGAVGSDLQMEYTALGDAINLAARMEQTAQPGTVQVAEETYRLVTPVFEWQDLGEMELKGKDAPVHTYRPLRRKSEPGRLRGIAGLDAPMVGRSAELEKVMAGLGRLAGGQGGIAFITGEAGLGKSRLIREISNTEYAIRFTFHEAASFSYETSQPYALFQRLLRRVYGVQEGDSALEMWEKFLPALQHIPPDIADQGSLFEALFAASRQGGSGAPESGAPAPERDAFRRQLFEVMTALAAGWAEARPLVLILDDLHWTDTASAELLAHLFGLAERAPVFFLCAMRPETETPGWRARAAALEMHAALTTEISLSALTASDTYALVNHLLLVAELPERLRRSILEKSDGNPFFIEEVVRTLIDAGAVVQETQNGAVHWRAVGDMEDVEIPGNLQTLLTARIDRLEEDARRTLQLAAVIGRSFYYRVLDSINRAVVVVRAQIEPQLTALQKAEMIIEAARVPELEYAFRHALTQEAAYSTILLRQRREFHRQVGEAIEHLFADRLEEFYPILARHFGEADDPRAQGYETRAGDAAFRVFAIPEAISHYQRAIGLAAKLPADADGVTHLFTRLGRCHELLSQHGEAVRTYDEMIAHARQQGSRPMELAGLVALGTITAIPSPVQDPERAGETSRAALALARELGDQHAEARIQWNFLLKEMYSGRMDLGIPYGERAAELARSLGMQEVLAHALQDTSLAYMAVGDLPKARAALAEALPLWETQGNQPMISENIFNGAFGLLLAGDFPEAIRLMEQSFAISQRIQNEWGQANTRVFISQIYMAQGNMDAALRIQETSIPLAQKVGHPGSALIMIQQAWTYSHLGLPHKARALADAAVSDAAGFAPFLHYAQGVAAQYALRAGDHELARHLHTQSAIMRDQKTLLEIDIVLALVDAEFQLADGRLDAAARAIHSLLDLLRRSGAKYFLPEALMLQAEIAAGNPEASRAALLEARAMAADMQFRACLWQILARLAEAAGEVDTAGQYRAEAIPVVQYIADHTSDPALRASFLGFAASQGITPP